MNPRSIHETKFMELLKPVTDIYDDVSGSYNKSKAKVDTDIKKMSSITRAASGLTLVFPTICSTAVDTPNAIMINKALERKNVTVLQILLSAYNFSNSDNALEFIKQFHTNIGNKVDLDTFIDVMDGIVNESFTDPEIVRQIAEDCRQNLNYFFEENINRPSLGSIAITERYGKLIITEAPKYRDIDDNDINSTDDDTNTKFDKKVNYNRMVSGMEKNELDRQKALDDKADKDRRYELDKGKNEREQKKFDGEDYASQYQVAKDRYELNRNRLVSSDVKKANEMVPTLIVVNWVQQDRKIESQAVVGVKSKLYPVQSSDVINKIITKHTDSNIFLKLIKASTREISFVKDFLFAIDNAKLDALSKSKRGSSSRLFKALERRSLKGKIRKLMKRDMDAKPISALVITQEEVEDLKKYNNIDVEIPSIIIPIMEKLNLLYFVIVDETTEVVKLLVDGDSEYETLTFDSLEKESNDGSYKKVINLMSKMSR